MLFKKNLLLNSKFHERKRLKEFYTQLFDIDLSAQDSEKVVRGFIAFNSNRIVLANINKINRLLEKVNPYTRIGLKSNLSFRLKQLEPIIIPEIIYLLKNEKDVQLDERFFLYVVDSLRDDINSLTPELKGAISSYIDSVKHKYDYNKILLGKRASILSYGAWLEASALVNSSTLEEAGKYIADFLENYKSLNEQESYIIGLSSSSYLKKAFDEQKVLTSFKKQRKEVYLNTVAAGSNI